MSPFALFATAWASIGGNRLRTVLTLLGIIIGVAAVISLMSIGRGAQASVTSRIESLGSDLVYVRSLGGELTLDDSLALADPVFAPSVEAVAPELQTGAAVAFEQTEMFSELSGVTSDFVSVRNFEIETGEFISPAHVLNRNSVAVLGSETAVELFGARSPVGAAILINGLRFTVIGVLRSKGANALGNEDYRVLVPITTAFFRLSGTRTAAGDILVSTINVKVDGERIDEAVREITILMRLRHKITDQDDFIVSTQQSVIDALSEATSTLTVFLGAVAGISLVVGGIGIMNIMLVSVTERTREIGVRKALGAKRGHILAQFVTEAVLLSLGGGLLGVGAGVVVSRMLNGVTLIGIGVSTVFSGDIAALALVVSAGIGLFFGIYPAARAARLHPIDALRHE